MLNKLRGFFNPRRTRPAPLHDAVLGTLEFNVERSLWEARLGTAGNSLSIFIAGASAPDPKLLEHARAVAANESSFRVLVSSFLDREAPGFRGGEAEVRSLRLESLELVWPDRPNDGMIYFEGGDSDRVWRCDYINRKPVGLGFDS